MSHHDQHEAHTGPIKNAKQMVWASIASFVVPVFIIIGLVYYVTSANKEAPGASDPERALAERIQKVGMVEVRDANRPLKAGEEVTKPSAWPATAQAPQVPPNSAMPAPGARASSRVWTPW